jgi:hypothetical protein
VSASYRAGRRGRHKRKGSPETQRWEQQHLVPPRPDWMAVEVYVKLARLRGES